MSRTRRGPAGAGKWVRRPCATAWDTNPTVSASRSSKDNRRRELRRSLQREHGIDLGLDLGLRRAACDGDLLDEQVLRRVHHLPLAEGQVLAVLEDEEVPQDPWRSHDGARLDLLQVFAVTLVPGLLVDRDVTGTEDLVDFRSPLDEMSWRSPMACEAFLLPSGAEPKRFITQAAQAPPGVPMPTLPSTEEQSGVVSSSYSLPAGQRGAGGVVMQNDTYQSLS